VKLNEPLSAHTSFRIGGPADALVVPADREDLVALMREIAGKGLKFAILGGGTNLLVRDGGFRGVVISLERMDKISIVRQYRSLGGTFSVVYAEAGALLARLMNMAADNALTGMEFAAGIPGTVGGAVCMNAGTALGEIGDVIDTVTLLSPGGEQAVKHHDELGFGYRTAKIPPGHVVLDIKLILRHGDRQSIREKVNELMEMRKERQPGGLPNAGSVFKNPLDEAAGKLIEAAGLKGTTAGRAQVSEKHANFIVNLGGAKAKDVLALMEIIQQRVLETHKVRLEPEIKIIGED
jgi:UDP-N-acetylmuramate dehydrogenase